MSILSILIAGAGLYFWMGQSSHVEEETKPAPLESPSLDYYEYPLGTFFLPLANIKSKEDLFLKLSIGVSAKDEETIAEIKENAIYLRKELYTFLKSKRLEDVDGKNARERLNKEMLLRINNSLQSGTIEKVFFTEFFIM